MLPRLLALLGFIGLIFSLACFPLPTIHLPPTGNVKPTPTPRPSSPTPTPRVEACPVPSSFGSEAPADPESPASS